MDSHPFPRAGGEVLAETNGSGNTLNEYVFVGGKRVALLPAGSTAQFYAEDMLGSSRIVTTNTGAVCYDADFYPFGGERTYISSCTQNNYKFEGKERDTETGNDDFGARYYSNRFGRWLSADWSSVPVAVPYANLTNPQTLNLYAMVADDPESFADLDGHCPANDPQCNSLKPNPDTRVSSATKEAINDSVAASNSPTNDDKNGGSHEEGGVSYPNPKDGKETIAPAQPGAYRDVKQPGVAEINPYKAADPKLQKPGDVQASVDWHVHPKAEVVETEKPKAGAGAAVFGGTEKTTTYNFGQPPSTVDKNAANPGTIHIVVGARDK